MLQDAYRVCPRTSSSELHGDATVVKLDTIAAVDRFFNNLGEVAGTAHLQGPERAIEVGLGHSLDKGHSDLSDMSRRRNLHFPIALAQIHAAGRGTNKPARPGIIGRLESTDQFEAQPRERD